MKVEVETSDGRTFNHEVTDINITDAGALSMALLDDEGTAVESFSYNARFWDRVKVTEI